MSTVKARKVRDAPVNVRGVKVTQNNIGAIVLWLEQAGIDAEGVLDNKKTKARESDNRVRVKTKAGWRVARPGDVILRGVVSKKKDAEKPHATIIKDAGGRWAL